LGSRVWDQTAGFTLELGPMDRAALIKFLPNGEWHRRLAILVEFVLAEAFDVELRLLLRPDEVPPGKFEETPRLAWTSWLGKTKPRSPAIVTVRLRRTDANPLCPTPSG
jgi:type VI secretion system protein ImpH